MYFRGNLVSWKRFSISLVIMVSCGVGLFYYSVEARPLVQQMAHDLKNKPFKAPKYSLKLARELGFHMEAKLVESDDEEPLSLKISENMRRM